MNAPAFAWVIALPLLASPAVYILGRLRVRGLPACTPQALALLALACALVPFTTSARDLAAGAAVLSAGTVALRFDGIGLLVAALALALGIAVVTFSGQAIRGEPGDEKYFALVLALTGSIVGLACAADLFNLWLWFEAMALSSYLLVAFHRTQPASLEAGVKYLVQSATGSALVLLGIALVLAQSGTLDLTLIQSAIVPGPLTIAAGALFVCGFGVKSALVPLHTWLPDAHAQAPSGISALLSGVVIEAGLIALLRALAPLAPLLHSEGLIVLSLGALNMAAGNLLALRQTQLKRMLAYSSIAQMGYLLLGIGISLQTGLAAGAQGGFFHLLNHGLMKGLAFLAAGALLYALHARTLAQDKPLEIAELAGAAQRYPLPALCLSLALLALAGLPPRAGFMSKWQIFVAGFESGDLLLGGLVAFAALNSVVSLAYYVPPVNALYRQQASPAVLNGRPLPASMRAPLVALALSVVLIGIWPGLLNGLTVPAASALLEMLR